MQILYQRTGGFAGLRINGKIDLEELEDEIVEKIERLLEKSEFFELPERLESPPQAADQFNYTITVESKKGVHSVTFCHPVSESLGELSELLFRLMRRQKRRN